MAVTPDAKGYFLLQASGTVTGFGDAKYEGSLTANSSDPPVAIAGLADTGYYVLERNGTLKAFGSAKAYTNETSVTSFVGAAATHDEGGFYLV
jgi:hypothetical protein